MKKTSKILIAVLGLIAVAAVALTVFPAWGQTKKTGDKVVINTTEMCKDVIGHHATTPLEITVEGGKITDIKVLPSDETPSFYEMAVKVLDAFKGMTVQQALEAEVDAVSGATLSSDALITNVQTGLKSLQK
ncbi:MAG: FMN-binding protein [Bacteroidales bacterium]|jgi:uncharacterized protein with FMN-binding domain|nr:FMN-binding protein [Bacteroidales bacterium]